MALECPICGVRLGSSDVDCSGCGYPLGLHPEAVRAFRDDDVGGPTPTKPGSVRSGGATTAVLQRPATVAPRARDQTAEACARSAKELQGHLALLQQMGGNVGPFAGALRQAALVQAEGKIAESLDLLRASEEEANRGLTELFAQRAQELEHRATVLRQDGIAVDADATLTRLHGAISSADRTAAAGLVVTLDRELSTLERDWRGLHSLLQQIRDLQGAAREAGRPITEVDTDLASVKSLLERPQIDAELIDSASQISARALMMLHESLPEILEKDLDRHGATLSAYPSEHTPSRRAKALHSEVTRHLRRSRLSEAAKGLHELRAELQRLATASPPVPVAAAPAGEPGGEDALPALLAKARALASRVRALAPDSDTAYEAAGEIRRATELLKARKLEEADAALTHLMRTLDAAPPEEP